MPEETHYNKTLQPLHTLHPLLSSSHSDSLETAWRQGRCCCLPVTEPDQDCPVELVLGAVGLRTTGVDERVNGSQNEALLVKLLQLARKLPHRREA